VEQQTKIGLSLDWVLEVDFLWFT